MKFGTDLMAGLCRTEIIKEFNRENYTQLIRRRDKAETGNGTRLMPPRNVKI